MDKKANTVSITLDLDQLYALNKLLDEHKKNEGTLIVLDTGENISAYKLAKTIRHTIVYNEEGGLNGQERTLGKSAIPKGLR
jgi:hypothetical protein|tara:strand:- start:207 stop:452 length:246 start_codon:yes stop_codon:yes gene_type:complete